MASVEKFQGRWRVRWRNDEGNQKCKTFSKKVNANGYKAKVEHELAQGMYLEFQQKSWSEFREQYDRDVLSLKGARTRGTYTTHLGRFEEIAKPSVVCKIKTATIDRYISERSKMAGELKGDSLSPSTINAELRTIKAAIRRAEKWKYIRELPEFNFVSEPSKMKRFMPEDHFAAIYEACEAATYPEGRPYAASDWWRGLLVFLWFTGWRISEPTALLRADVDLEVATAKTRHEDNKGNRDELVRLCPVVVDHLRCIQSFDEQQFSWPHSRRYMYVVWHRIQDAAGIELDCHRAGKHKCTTKCHHYGFHDIRRAFATTTGADLTPTELKTIMRHRDFSTTERYIAYRERAIGMSTDKLKVPGFLRKGAG